MTNQRTPNVANDSEGLTLAAAFPRTRRSWRFAGSSPSCKLTSTPKALPSVTRSVTINPRLA